MIDARRNHPCIVMWVPFNEGWGQFDTVRVVEWIKKYDPTRLVDCASGWNDFPAGDVHDIHVYPRPRLAEAGGEAGCRAGRVRRPGPAAPGPHLARNRTQLGLPRRRSRAVKS